MASQDYPGTAPAREGPACGQPLLAADEPSPVVLVNPAGSSPFLLIGDHAGISIPRSLDSLGVSDADLARHIACDIGVRALGERLSAMLDAPFLHQHYSRLVIDCNRDPASPEAVPPESDGTPIPGNRDVDAAARAERVAAIHETYHAAITDLLDARDDRPTILIALHSFTPVMDGSARPWDIGILHDRGETRFARGVLARLAANPDFTTGDNEPYRMDATDHSMPRHAYPRGLAYVEVEFRQDHLAITGGPARWADRLAAALTAELADQGLRSTAGSPGSGSTP